MDLTQLVPTTPLRELPLTPELNKVLLLNGSKICSIMRLEGVLMELIIGKQILSSYELDDLQSKQTNYDKNQYFLEQMRRGSMQRYTDFISALNASHNELVTLFSKQSQRLSKQYSDLLASKLLDLAKYCVYKDIYIALISFSVISMTENERIMKQFYTNGDMIHAFVKLLIEEKTDVEYHKFIDVLKKTDKLHVAHLLGAM